MLCMTSRMPRIEMKRKTEKARRCYPISPEAVRLFSSRQPPIEPSVVVARADHQGLGHACPWDARSVIRSLLSHLRDVVSYSTVRARVSMACGGRDRLFTRYDRLASGATSSGPSHLGMIMLPHFPERFLIKRAISSRHSTSS